MNIDIYIHICICIEMLQTKVLEKVQQTTYLCTNLNKAANKINVIRCKNNII